MGDGALNHWSQTVKDGRRGFVHLFNGSVPLPPSITFTINKFPTPGSNKDWRRPLLATILPPCAASVSFLCSLAIAQGAGKLLRVSCATPVVAPIVGGLAVAAASATSAQVSFTVRKICENDGRFEKLELISQEKALFYAVFGVLAYKVLGGYVRNVMPSNVIRPGAHARSSIPSRGIKYANDVESGLIKDLFKSYGCQHACEGGHGWELLHSTNWETNCGSTALVSSMSSMLKATKCCSSTRQAQASVSFPPRSAAATSLDRLLHRSIADSGWWSTPIF